MSGYRDPGKARSPALEQLAAEARSAEAEPEVPAQTHLLPSAEETRRLSEVVGVAASGSGMLPMMAAVSWLGLAGLGMLAVEGDVNALGRVLLVVLLVTAVGTSLGALVSGDARTRRFAEAVDAELGWARDQPFPVTGYRDWLVSDVSILVIRLAAEIDPETFADAVKALDPAIETERVDGRAFRLVVPSFVVGGDPSMRHGNVRLLRKLFERLVLPLHVDVGIERVAMGGTVGYRPAPQVT